MEGSQELYACRRAVVRGMESEQDNSYWPQFFDQVGENIVS